MVFGEVTNAIGSIYNEFISIIPYPFDEFIKILLLVILILFYSIFIWKLYRFVAKKDFLGLNLKKYNKYEEGLNQRFLNGIFYFFEYLIISPFLIFFWFAIFSLFLILLTEDLNPQQILIVSTIIISAIRITSYYTENLSKDLAKMLPFTLLAIAITNPNFFKPERIAESINQIPSFLNNVFIYLIFIFLLEMLLRFFDFIVSLFDYEEEFHE